MDVFLEAAVVRLFMLAMFGVIGAFDGSFAFERLQN
jgi:hypothetical protein